MENQRSINDPQLDHFTHLVRKVEPFPLLEAAVCVGHTEYPELDSGEFVQAVSNVKSVMKNAIDGRESLLQRVDIVSRTFYQYYGFCGNVGTAIDPDQMYLHRVLQTGVGDSLSLGIIWLELAHAIDVPASGAMVSGYFVVSAPAAEGDWLVIDPLNGRLLDLPALEMMKTHQPYQGVTDPEKFLSEILVPATPRQIVGYLLQRLERINASGRHNDKRIAVLDRAIVLEPENWDAYRRRGLAYSELGERAAAVVDLSTYVDNADGDADTSAVVELLRSFDAD